MFAQPRERVASNGWSNIDLVQADAVDFTFPTPIDAILSTYALSQIAECADVIPRSAEALSGVGRMVVLDLKVPDNTPRWFAQLGSTVVRPFAFHRSLDDAPDHWSMRRPWEEIRLAMQEQLADCSWAELCFGTAFLAAGYRGSSATRRS